MARFYFSTLAARPMTLSGRTFRFTICSVMSGRANGVYEATDDAEIAVLSQAVANRRGVQEISEEQFAALKKKASQTPQLANSRGSKPPRVIRIPLLPEMTVAPKSPAKDADFAGAVDAHGNRVSNPDEPDSAPNIADLIQVQRVNPPKPFSDSDSKVRKSAARATARVARKAVK